MQPAAFVLCLSSFHIRWYSPHWMVSTPARSSLHKPPASASLRRSPRIRELAQRKTRTTSNIVIAPIQPHTPTRTPAHPKNMAASTTYNRRRRTSTVRIASPPPQLPQVRHRHQGRSNFLPPRTSHFTRMSEIIRGLQKILQFTTLDDQPSEMLEVDILAPSQVRHLPFQRGVRGTSDKGFFVLPVPRAS